MAPMFWAMWTRGFDSRWVVARARREISKPWPTGARPNRKLDAWGDLLSPPLMAGVGGLGIGSPWRGWTYEVN